MCVFMKCNFLQNGNALICLHIKQIYAVCQDEDILLQANRSTTSHPGPFNQMTLARQYFIGEIELVREIGCCCGM